MTVYEQHAVFDKGYDFPSFHAAIDAGESGLTLLTVGTHHVYLYYMPIQGTDWYMVTSMSYETVNNQIVYLSQFMAGVGAGIDLFSLFHNLWIGRITAHIFAPCGESVCGVGHIGDECTGGPRKRAVVGQE